MSNTWRNGFVDSFSLRRKHIFEGLTSYWWMLKGFVFNNLILKLLVFQKILVKPLEIQTNRCHKLQENLSCLALKANGLGNLKYCSMLLLTHACEVVSTIVKYFWWLQARP